MFIDKKTKEILTDIAKSLRILANREDSDFPIKSKGDKDFFKLRLESSGNSTGELLEEDKSIAEAARSEVIQEILEKNKDYFFAEDAVPLELLDN